MNILILSLWSVTPNSIGGTEKFVVDMANLLSESNSVTILSLGIADIQIPNVNLHSLNLINKLDENSLYLYLENGGFEKISESLNIFIKKNSFDIVHSNSLLFTNMIKNVPCIQTVHTNKTEFEASFPSNIKNKILENIQIDTHSSYVTPSKASEQSFIDLTNKTSTVIYHGFRPDIHLKNKAAVRKKYAISQNDIVFCVPSRFELEQKGQQILLEALSSIKDELPAFTVLLGGCDNPYVKNKSYLEKLFPNLSLKIENFSDRNDMYSLSDIVILPSRTESFGYSALESSMLGFPLFLSNIKPFQEIADGNPSIVLFKNTPEDLAQSLLQHRELIRLHKLTTPPQHWSEKFKSTTMIQKYVSLYKTHIINKS